MEKRRDRREGRGEERVGNRIVRKVVDGRAKRNLLQLGKAVVCHSTVNRNKGARPIVDIKQVANEENSVGTDVTARGFFALASGASAVDDVGELPRLNSN